MELAFYTCSLIAILTTLMAIIHINPIHALLYLIVSLIAISGVCFSLGAYFSGALEIIIYAGAIMVIFVFAAIMLNLGDQGIKQEIYKNIKLKAWIYPILLSIIMLLLITYSIIADNSVNYLNIIGIQIPMKELGIYLFGPYVIAVESISMLLLSSLIIAFHIVTDFEKRFY